MLEPANNVSLAGINPPFSKGAYIMLNSMLSVAEATPNITAVTEQGSGGAGALFGCLLIFGVLCAICNALGKKKSFDFGGTIRER